MTVTVERITSIAADLDHIAAQWPHLAQSFARDLVIAAEIGQPTYGAEVERIERTIRALLAPDEPAAPADDIPAGGMGFLRRYGGVRQRIADHERTVPVCPTCGIGCRPRRGAYYCAGCSTIYRHEGLAGLQWVVA
jgi:hypothetical protein